MSTQVMGQQSPVFSWAVIQQINPKNTLQKYVAMQKHALLCYCCVTAAVTKLSSQGCKSKAKLFSNVCAIKPDVLLFR